MIGQAICRHRSNLMILLLLCMIGLSLANVVPVFSAVAQQGIEYQYQSNALAVQETPNTTISYIATPDKSPSDDNDVGNARGNLDSTRKLSELSELTATSSLYKDEDEGNQASFGAVLKTTKPDDWYYDPDETNGEDENWNEDENSKINSYDKKEKDMATPAPDAIAAGDDGDDTDETYDIISNMKDTDHIEENNDEEAQEKLPGEDKMDGDVDEKLLEDVVDEDLVRKNKPPTAPSSMVLFYTWMILAVLIMVIGISTYQARCKGLPLSSFHRQARDDRKRLVDHEYT